jgi:hypothetical protein
LTKRQAISFGLNALHIGLDAASHLQQDFGRRLVVIDRAADPRDGDGF